MGKSAAVGPARFRVDAVGPRRAAATTQEVGADDEVAVGVDRFARPDDEVPPSGRVVRIVPGDVRIARQGMADQNGVVGRRAELAVGLVGHPHDGQGTPFFQGKRFLEGDILGIFQRNSRANAVAAIENASVGRHAF